MRGAFLYVDHDDVSEGSEEVLAEWSIMKEKKRRLYDAESAALVSGATVEHTDTPDHHANEDIEDSEKS